MLLPSILGALTLLFANAFGAQATAYALVGGGAGQNLVVTVMVGAQFSTDSFANPGLGNALALRHDRDHRHDDFRLQLDASARRALAEPLMRSRPSERR